MVGETLERGASPADRRLRVYLAGAIAIRGVNGVTISERDLAGRQARRLLVRLIAIHEPVPHAELADDLWDTEWPPAWDVALRAIISKVRSALAHAGAPGSLVSVGGTYAMRLPSGSWLDVDAAAESIHRAETALASGRVTDAGGAALTARAIASRPVLPGEEAEWLDTMRARLDDIRLRALECLGEIWIARSDPALAARDAAEAIRMDPYRESAHRLLIRAHIAAEDRAAAARAYEACRRLLEADLGVAPSDATQALAETVLRSR